MRCIPREVVMTSLNSPLRRVKAACSKVGSPCPRETQPRSPQSWPALSAVEHSECCWHSLRKATSLWFSSSPSEALPCSPMRRRPSNILTSSASASAGVRCAPAAWFPRAAARGLRAMGSSGRLFPASAQRRSKCRTRTERGPGMPFWRFAGRLAAKRSSMMPASPSSSSRSRTQTQMAEADVSCLLSRASALLAHWRAATFGCHWQTFAVAPSSARPSSAVAPQQSATRMASPTRHEAARTAAFPPMPLRSLRPSASRPLPLTPSASRRSAAAAGAPPCRANLKVSSAVVKASRARRASASASFTAALTTKDLTFSNAFFTCVSSASASTFSMDAAPLCVKGSHRSTR
mmetsp:Transcript_35043/g.83519  ORF Transcript_35043/g.83519 Transcript_35043/m.83519 type:complete len:349 (-) Transcript_35043:1205-2251(-)